MNAEQLHQMTTDFAAQTIGGQYYLGSSIGLSHTELPPMSELEPGDWIIRTEPILYGFILGFDGLLESVSQCSGQSCCTSLEELNEWLATPMDSDAPELTCKYQGLPGELYVSKNEAGNIVAFSFIQ